MNPIAKEQIDAILPFLDCFEAEDFSIDARIDEPSQVPGFVLSEHAMKFYDALYDNGWVAMEFDWPVWQHKAKDYVNSPDSIGATDAQTIQKLFTTHVRKERFCEGHLTSMFRIGHITALLRRLREIRDTME